MTTVELAKASGILAWAHSYHSYSVACGQCRSCMKHIEATMELVGKAYLRRATCETGPGDGSARLARTRRCAPVRRQIQIAETRRHQHIEFSRPRSGGNLPIDALGSILQQTMNRGSESKSRVSVQRNPEQCDRRARSLESGLRCRHLRVTTILSFVHQKTKNLLHRGSEPRLAHERCSLPCRARFTPDRLVCAASRRYVRLCFSQ